MTYVANQQPLMRLYTLILTIQQNKSWQPNGVYSVECINFV
jgi:hypothetical protein